MYTRAERIRFRAETGKSVFQPNLALLSIMHATIKLGVCVLDERQTTVGGASSTRGRSPDSPMGDSVSEHRPSLENCLIDRGTNRRLGGLIHTNKKPPVEEICVTQLDPAVDHLIFEKGRGLSSVSGA